jgi:hypothetical protein
MKTYFKAKLPSKVYLSGADCFHLVLDMHASKHEAGGNVMRRTFLFDKPLQLDKIENILRSSPIIYWLCNIKLISGPFLFKPYWEFKDRGNDIIVREHLAVQGEDIPRAILERDITIKDTRFIEADIVQYENGTCMFVISWNHILLDAKGTTLLFDHLNELTEGKPTNFDIFFPEKGTKTNIVTYIRNMYKVKRFVQASSKSPVSSVAEKQNSNNENATYQVLHFTKEETAKINANAFKNGARFGETLFFISTCAHVVNAINKQRNKLGTLWIPVPYDGRLKGAAGPLVSNCVSFLFYRLPQSEMGSIAQTVKSLSMQMVNQIKNNMPKKYSMFLNMMRHIPLWLYYFLISKTSDGVFASFLYTTSGDKFVNLKTLFGEPIVDISLIPSLTFPPGLTFVFLNYNDKLNVNVTYSPDIINKSELQLIEQKIKEILLADY